MEHSESFEPISLSREGVTSSTEPWMSLNVAVMYQDAITRGWALQLDGRTTEWLGSGAMHSTWWKMDFLDHSKIFEESVKAVLVADLLIVAVHASEVIPPSLERWFGAWLPQRTQGDGALVAMVGTTGKSGPALAFTLEYLRRVANRGGLDFIPQEKRVMPESSSLATALNKGTIHNGVSLPG